MENKNIKEQIKLRLKKDKLKINATLSSVFNMLGLNPVKTLADIGEKAKTLPKNRNKFFVKIVQYEDDSCELDLMDFPDSVYLKQITSQIGVDYSEKLTQYAKQTMHKSYCKTVEGRVKELEGILKSIKRS
jgi:ribosomal protein L11